MNTDNILRTVKMLDDRMVITADQFAELAEAAVLGAMVSRLADKPTEMQPALRLMQSHAAALTRGFLNA